MATAVEAVLRQYATFRGRARRSEYWYFVLFQFIVGLVAAALDFLIFRHSSVFSLICSLGLIVPGLAVSVRRLHDTNRTGWWLLIGFVPFFGAVILLVWFITKGTAGPNRFGEDPIATLPAFTT